MKCDNCVQDTELCLSCCDNPIYAEVPRTSKFMAYRPTCPQGYKDCVCDPAYIKCYHPAWYKDLYGDMSPEDASKKNCRIDDDYCYDDEDK